MQSLRRPCLIAALICVECLLFSTANVLAGTTGAIQGFVTDSGHHPLVGVKVSAVAPSASATTTSQANGFFSLNGLPVDVYTVSFSRDGYVTKSIHGVTNVQDQYARISAQLETDIKTLARVSVRSAASLFQPTATADTYVINQATFENINGTPQDLNSFGFYNALPGVMGDSAGIPTIRAGATNEVGYLYDGIDNTDPVITSVLNAASLNGTRSIQLATGGYDVSEGNTNTGVINQVIKRGTYPPRGQSTIRLGSPVFGHELSFDYGGASPNNRFSYYFSFGGQRYAWDYGNRHTLLPLLTSDSASNSTDDSVLNLFYRFGPSEKNEVQFLSNISAATLFFGYHVNPAIAPFPSNNGDVQAGSDPFGLGPQPVGRPSTFQSDYTTLFPGQVAYRQNTNSIDNLTANSIIDKLNFKRQLTPSSFAEARLFRTSEDFVNSSPYGLGSFTDFWADLQVTGLGEAFDYAKQLNSKHELSFGGEGVYYKNSSFGAAGPSLEPTFEPLEDLGCPQIAAAIASRKLTPSSSFLSTPGVGGCYIAPLNNALNIAVPGLGLPIDAAHAPLSTYVNDFVYIFDPAYRYNLWLKDRYQPTERLTMTLGVRCDKEILLLPADAAAQNSTYFLDAAGNFVTVPGRPIGSDVTRPSQISPRFALAYQLDARDILRFSYGKNIEFAPLYAIERAFRVPTQLQNCTIANGCFRALPGYGLTNAVTNLYQQVTLDLSTNESAQYAPVRPQRAFNADLSLSHDFGNGLEMRITPYYRKGDDYVVLNQPLLFQLASGGRPVFGSARAQNAGVNRNVGVEFALQRNAPKGFSGLLSATYDNTLSNYDGDFFPSVNNAALAAGHFFHVTYVPALSAALNVVYNQPAVWHAATTISFQSGYRYGVGKKTFTFVNGVPTQVLNTDLANSSSQAFYFTDATNPGTILSPNITASRGTPEGDDPGTLFTPATALVNVSLAHNIGRQNAELGIRVQNLFGNYTPPPVNSNGSGTVIASNLYYVPQGIGGYGPGSGVNTNACGPGQSFGCEPFMYNRSPYPYESEPSGPARLYTFFLSVKY